MNDADIPLYKKPRKANFFGNMTAKEIGREVSSHKARIARAIDLCDATLIEKTVLRDMIKMMFSHNRDPAAALGLTPRVAIYPGKRMLAWSATVSQSSVKRALKKWRESGCIAACGYVKGGRNATRYQIIDKVILALKGAPYVRLETGSKQGQNRVKTGSKQGHCDPRHSVEIDHNVVEISAFQKATNEKPL